MKLENEFKKYIKDFANKTIEYDISNDEINDLYNGFFDKDRGIINFMISSRILDFMYEKEKFLNKEMDNSNELVC